MHINLFQLQVGNALTDDYHDHYGVFQFIWAAGMISDQTFRLLNLFCDFQSFVHASSECENILDVASQEMGNIDPYSIFTPSCPANATMSRNKLFKRLHVSLSRSFTNLQNYLEPSLLYNNILKQSN